LPGQDFFLFRGDSLEIGFRCGDQIDQFHTAPIDLSTYGTGGFLEFDQTRFDVAPPLRRSLVEHIRASGGFLWRYHYHSELLQSIQRDLRREMRISHPLTQGMDAARAAAHLADIIALPEADIRAALSPLYRPSAKQFTHTVRLLTVLRKQL